MNDDRTPLTAIAPVTLSPRVDVLGWPNPAHHLFGPPPPLPPDFETFHDYVRARRRPGDGLTVAALLFGPRPSTAGRRPFRFRYGRRHAGF